MCLGNSRSSSFKGFFLGCMARYSSKSKGFVVIRNAPVMGKHSNVCVSYSEKNSTSFHRKKNVGGPLPQTFWKPSGLAQNSVFVCSVGMKHEMSRKVVSHVNSNNRSRWQHLESRMCGHGSSVKETEVYDKSSTGGTHGNSRKAGTRKPTEQMMYMDFNTNAIIFRKQRDFGGIAFFPINLKKRKSGRKEAYHWNQRLLYFLNTLLFLGDSQNIS